jgi:hypothetical protein
MLSTTHKEGNLLYVRAVPEPSLSLFGSHGFVHCFREDIMGIDLVTVMENIPKVFRVPPNVVLHCGKPLFNGVEIWAVGGQEYKLDPSVSPISKMSRENYVLLTLLQPWLIHHSLYVSVRCLQQAQSVVEDTAACGPSTVQGTLHKWADLRHPGSR